MTINTASGIQRGGGADGPLAGPIANIVNGNQLLLSQVLQSTTDTQAPVTLAKIVLQLNGSISKVCPITLTKLEISESSGDTPGTFRQKESTAPKNFLRGDANGNGQIDRDDALFIAELIARIKGRRRECRAGETHSGWPA